VDPITLALAKKRTEYSLKNEIVNGNFCDGVVGWSGEVSTTLSAVNNTLSIASSGASFSITASQDIEAPFILNKKYYMRCRMRVTNALCKRLAIVTSQSDFSTVLVASQKTPAENTWYNISGVLVSTVSGSAQIRINHLYDTTETAIGAVAECQYVSVINLTDAFGAGNEPTKEEMDELLTYFPESWFDGRTTLPGKWVMTYLLNQVRNLKAAVVGLGGTV
jgi:hypothetical protein